jgi:hypothetical protein
MVVLMIKKIIQNFESTTPPCPVLVGGMQASYYILGIPVAKVGHMWVVEGYKDYYVAGDGVAGGENYLYYYINWGWSGSYNGWYSLDTWASPNGNYNCYNDMIYNIHP